MRSHGIHLPLFLLLKGALGVLAYKSELRRTP